MMEEKVVDDSMQDQNVVYDDGTFQLVKIVEKYLQFLVPQWDLFL